MENASRVHRKQQWGWQATGTGPSRRSATCGAGALNTSWPSTSSRTSPACSNPSAVAPAHTVCTYRLLSGFRATMIPIPARDSFLPSPRASAEPGARPGDAFRPTGLLGSCDWNERTAAPFDVGQQSGPVFEGEQKPANKSMPGLCSWRLHKRDRSSPPRSQPLLS